MYSLSSGPGDASEWYWMVSTGNSRWRMPSIVPSFRFRCVTSMAPGSASSETANPWFCAVM